MLFELTLSTQDHFNVDNCGCFYVETFFRHRFWRRKTTLIQFAFFNLNSTSDQRRSSTLIQRWIDVILPAGFFISIQGWILGYLYVGICIGLLVCASTSWSISLVKKSWKNWSSQFILLVKAWSKWIPTCQWGAKSGRIFLVSGSPNPSCTMGPSGVLDRKL